MVRQGLVQIFRVEVDSIRVGRFVVQLEVVVVVKAGDDSGLVWFGIFYYVVVIIFLVVSCLFNGLFVQGEKDGRYFFVDSCIYLVFSRDLWDDGISRVGLGQGG